MTNIKIGNWQLACRCSTCNSLLSYYEVMYSQGICPHCGNDSKSTIIAYKKEVYRTIVKTEFSWKFPFITRSREIEYKKE